MSDLHSDKNIPINPLTRTLSQKTQEENNDSIRFLRHYFYEGPDTMYWQLVNYLQGKIARPIYQITNYSGMISCTRTIARDNAAKRSTEIFLHELLISYTEHFFLKNLQSKKGREYLTVLCQEWENYRTLTLHINKWFACLSSTICSKAIQILNDQVFAKITDKLVAFLMEQFEIARKGETVPEEQIKQIIQYFRLLGIATQDDVSLLADNIQEQDISKYQWVSRKHSIILGDHTSKNLAYKSHIYEKLFEIHLLKECSIYYDRKIQEWQRQGLTLFDWATQSLEMLNKENALASKFFPETSNLYLNVIEQKLIFDVADGLIKLKDDQGLHLDFDKKQSFCKMIIENKDNDKQIETVVKWATPLLDADIDAVIKWATPLLRADNQVKNRHVFYQGFCKIIKGQNDQEIKTKLKSTTPLLDAEIETVIKFATPQLRTDSQAKNFPQDTTHPMLTECITNFILCTQQQHLAKLNSKVVKNSFDKFDYVEGLIKMKERADQVINSITDLLRIQGIKNDTVYSNMANVLTDYFNNIMNNTFQKQKTIAIKKAVNDYPETHKFLASYINNLLINETKHKSQDQNNKILYSAISLIEYLIDKDKFIEIYMVDLAIRLLSLTIPGLPQMPAYDIEKTVLDKITLICTTNQQLTAHAKAMTEAVELFPEGELRNFYNGDDYKKAVVNQKLIKDSFACFVGIHSKWPGIITQQINYKIPQEIQEFHRVFEAYYYTAHDRRLVWNFNFRNSLVRWNISDAISQQLIMSNLQLLIVLLFNKKPSYTFKEMQFSIYFEQDLMENKIDIRTLQLHLASIVSSSILVCSKQQNEIKAFRALPPDQQQQQKMKPHQCTSECQIFYNSKLAAGGKRIKKPTLSPATYIVTESDKEMTEQELLIQEKRNFQIDAGLVAIMKARKQMRQQMLVQELQTLIELFEPTLAQVRSRIVILIEKDYFERDPNDEPHGLKYKP